MALATAILGELRTRSVVCMSQFGLLVMPQVMRSYSQQRFPYITYGQTKKHRGVSYIVGRTSLYDSE